MSIALYLLSSSQVKIAHGVNDLRTRNQFDYEKFANWKWDDIYKFNFKPSVQAYMDWVNKDKPANSLTFEPT